ncbi:MAG: nucleotidyltransferase family protein [candidate division KSB1 bacterium]|nr:nucleotidyltransferase family protein [candidate division KSB1 bacterium]
MKTIADIQKTIKDIYPKLERDYHVKCLGLFGSYVRGEQTTVSDVDLLVTFSVKPSLFQFIELENILSDRLGIKVDLVMESSLKPRIGKQIKKEIVMI